MKPNKPGIQDAEQTKPLTPKAITELTTGILVLANAIKQQNINVEIEQDTIKFVYTNCNECGERIYVTNERMAALKTYKNSFYCSQGHKQHFL